MRGRSVGAVRQQEEKTSKRLRRTSELYTVPAPAGISAHRRLFAACSKCQEQHSRAETTPSNLFHDTFLFYELEHLLIAFWSR
jgi:hypothetical protein